MSEVLVKITKRPDSYFRGVLFFIFMAKKYIEMRSNVTKVSALF